MYVVLYVLYVDRGKVGKFICNFQSRLRCAIYIIYIYLAERSISCSLPLQFDLYIFPLKVYVKLVSRVKSVLDR